MISIQDTRQEELDLSLLFSTAATCLLAPRAGKFSPPLMLRTESSSLGDQPVSQVPGKTSGYQLPGLLQIVYSTLPIFPT